MSKKKAASGRSSAKSARSISQGKQSKQNDERALLPFEQEEEVSVDADDANDSDGGILVDFDKADEAEIEEPKVEEVPLVATKAQLRKGAEVESSAAKELPLNFDEDKAETEFGAEELDQVQDQADELDGELDEALGDVGEMEFEPHDAPLATAEQKALLVELLSLEAKVEAIIFASPKPIKPSEIEETIGTETLSSKEINRAIDRLVEFYEERGGGFKLEYLKNLGYQFRTVPAAAPLMERMFSTRPRPLSRAAMETLSVVAYRQPVTRSEIEFIRGVDAGSILKNLLERDLVKCVGRKADSGRPMLFGTSDEFLRVFRLNSLEELPSLSSFQTDPALIRAAMEKLDAEQAVAVEGFIGSEDDLALEPETTEAAISAGQDDGGLR